METQSTSKPRFSSRHKALAVFLGLIAVAVFGWFATQMGLTTAVVKNQLDAAAVSLKEQGAQHGRQVEFTYGDVEILGGFANKYALVHNPKLVMKPQSGEVGTPQKPNSLLITTPVMEIYPKSMDLSALHFLFPQVISVASEEAPTTALLKIEPTQPLGFAYAKETVDGVAYEHFSNELPRELRLTYLTERQAAGKEDATPEIVPVYDTLVVTSEKAETRLRLATDQSGLGSAQIAFKDLSVMPSALPEGTIKLGQLTGEWSNRKDANGLRSVDMKLNLDALTANEEIIPYAPVTLAFDATTQQHDAPLNLSGEKAPAAEGSSYQIRTFNLTTRDANFSATADFKTPAGELMPIGTSSVKATNVPYIISELREANLMDDSDEQLAVSVISKIAGKPYEEVHDLDVAIQRTAGQSFTIGKSTFEELFALVLQNRLEKFTDGDVKIIRNPEAAEPVEPPSDAHRG